MISIKALTRARHASREEAIEILEEAIELIEKTEEKDQIAYYVSACIRYLLSVREDISKEEMQKIASRISIEGGELVMTVAESLQKEAVLEEKAEMVRRGIIKGYSIKEISDITGLTEEEVKEVKKEMLK